MVGGLEELLCDGATSGLTLTLKSTSMVDTRSSGVVPICKEDPMIGLEKSGANFGIIRCLWRNSSR